MKQYKIKKYNNNFLKTKGIYVIVGLSVVVAGTFSWMGVNNQLKELDQNNQQQVENKQEDIQKPNTPQPPSTSQPSPLPDSTTSQSTNESNKGANLSTTSPKPSFLMPIDGKILNPYSKGELVKSKTLNDWRTHNGIDIAAKANDPVKAVSDGVIKDIYESPMWGTVIELELSDKTICRYTNLNKNVSVKKGQSVKQGDAIATVGKTAAAEIGEEDHLHFEVLKGEEYIDPMSLFKK
ncbi:MAG: peptidoglycan DD-metalloendopeptidase family protein [Oscillospiraceae bacterium]